MSLNQLGLRELIGTAGADAGLVAQSGYAVFGLAGNDVITTAPGGAVDTAYLAAGSGDDRYRVESGELVFLAENGGGNDVLELPGFAVGGERLALLTVDGGRHLFLVDLLSDTRVLALDWRDPASQVETFAFSDATLGVADVLARVTAGTPDSRFFGDLELDALTGNPEDSAALRAFFDLVDARAAELEGQNLPSFAEVAPPLVRLYFAAFNRVPEGDGLDFWVNVVRGGTDYDQVAAAFLASPEAQARFGVDPAPAAFVNQLYLNVLERPGEAGGVAFWIEQLAAGVGRPQVLRAFAESPENQAKAADVVAQVVGGAAGEDSAGVAAVPMDGDLSPLITGADELPV